jgi:uncharacterized protein (TIGR00369 family)
MFVPQAPDFEERVRDSFSRQKLMTTIGARLTRVAPGEVEIEMPYREDLTQQNGFIHAGIVTSIVDSACGFAAYSLMPQEADVLSVEFKLNLLSPAKGELLRARGRVLKPGRRVTVCAGDLYVVSDGSEKLAATMLATMMTVIR